MTKYQRSVSAALSETASKFAFAEALALDIPEQQGKGGVADALRVIREEIIEAGGEPKTVGTLFNYRKVALHFGRTTSEVEWAEGYSFTAHMEAAHNGIHPDQFRAKPQTAREIRQENGQSPENPEIVIANWTPEQKAAARDQLREEAVADIARENEARRVAVTSGDTDTKTPTPQIGATAGEDKRKIEMAMAEIMHFSRDTVRRAETAADKFAEAMPNPWWNKQVPGSTMYRTHEEQVLGDLDKAAEAVQKARVRVAKVIDKAQATV